MRTILIALLLSFTATTSGADVIRVGPHQDFVRIADAARHAKDGDLVEIHPGTYTADVTVWPQKSLTIMGLGNGPILDGNGTVAAGKAIWVFPHGDFKISNITFRGARAPDRNGAAIRFERGRLEIDNCRFEDNQMGVLTANVEDAELIIRDSQFSHAVRQTVPLPHLLYAGMIRRLEVSGSRFHGGYHGHLIKTRARETELRYNLIYDGPGGEASYEVEFPSGGDVLMVGNIVGQSAHTQNPVVVAYGAEQAPWPINRIRMSHNTLLSEALPGAWFLRVWKQHIPDPDVVAINNLSVGLGTFTVLNDGTFSGNRPAVSAMLRSPDTLDFRLNDGSLLEHSLESARTVAPELEPTAQFRLPLGTTPLAPRTGWSPGAMQQ